MRRNRNAPPEHISVALSANKTASFASEMTRRVTGKTEDELEEEAVQRRVAALRSGKLSSRTLFMLSDERLYRLQAYYALPDHALETLVVRINPACRLSESIEDDVREKRLTMIEADAGMRKGISDMLERNRKLGDWGQLPDYMLVRRISADYISNLSYKAYNND